MKKSVVFYLPSGFADWEGAFLMPELREIKYPMKIVSEDGSPVDSIEGLKVHVEGSLRDIKMEETEALIMIGSESWMKTDENQLALEMAKKFYQSGILVAGICAATVALARIGLLENIKHTSNDLGSLKYLVPDYRGEAHYQEKLAVTDKNMITAPGVGPIEFTLEIMKYLGIYTEEKRSQWYALYKNGVKPPEEFWS